MSRSRWGLVVAGVVVFLLVVGQVLIPSLGARKVENRLTEGGGSADVTIGAFPAERLLFGDGSRFEVEARDLDLGLDRDERVFDRLDGFSIVDVSIANSTAGPFQLTSFELTRDGEGPYTLTTDATTSPNELVDYGVEGLDLPGGGLAGSVLGLFGIDTNVEIPVALDMQLSSDDGRVQVVSGGGTIAGVSTGSLAELITAAIVVNL